MDFSDAFHYAFHDLRFGPCTARERPFELHQKAQQLPLMHNLPGYRHRAVASLMYIFISYTVPRSLTKYSDFQEYTDGVPGPGGEVMLARRLLSWL